MTPSGHKLSQNPALQQACLDRRKSIMLSA